MKCIKKSPTFQELLILKQISRTCLDDYGFYNKLKILLGINAISLFFGKFINKTYIIYNKEAIIGFGFVRLNFLRCFFITKQEQGKGYGKELLNYIESKLKGGVFNYKTLVLKPTKTSFSFYHKQGYKSKGRYMFKNL